MRPCAKPLSFLLRGPHDPLASPSRRLDIWKMGWKVRAQAIKTFFFFFGTPFPPPPHWLGKGLALTFHASLRNKYVLKNHGGLRPHIWGVGTNLLCWAKGSGHKREPGHITRFPSELKVGWYFQKCTIHTPSLQKHMKFSWGGLHSNHLLVSLEWDQRKCVCVLSVINNAVLPKLLPAICLSKAKGGVT